MDSLSAPLRPGPPYQDQDLINNFVKKEFNNEKVILDTSLLYICVH